MMRPRPIARIPGMLARPVLPLLLGRKERSDLVRIGSDYGGWTIPASLVHAESICYSVGVGEDTTFDEGLIEHFGCDVYAFDPTPRSIAHAETVADDEPRFHFFPYGVWSSETDLRFYAPRDPAHVSHSAVNLQGGNDYFVGSVKPIAAIVKELGHDGIDLLKLDVEGAEYEVLGSMLDDDLRPTILAVEFDQPMPLGRWWSICQRLLHGGYALVFVEEWNFTFVQKP